jgi:hypothetical protein
MRSSKDPGAAAQNRPATRFPQGPWGTPILPMISSKLGLLLSNARRRSRIDMSPSVAFLLAAHRSTKPWSP